MSNKLALTQSALLAPKDLKGVFEIEAFQNNFVQNYTKTTGKDNGALIFEREKILFMKAIQGNKKLESCDRFTVYSSFIELAVSGLTLNDGLAYIIPYGKAAQFQIGWKGRLEQLSQMPEIEVIPPPQVVYEKDDFDYELGDSPKIIKHKPYKGDDKGRLEYVYLVLHKTTGKETHIMSRDEVLAIRDQYSKGYKQYVQDCAAAGKKIGDTFKKNVGSYDITIEPPMWVSSEAEAWKKTLVKRVYKFQPKTPRMKALDEKIKTHPDNEDGTIEEEVIDYGVTDVEHVEVNGESVDQETGEVQEERKAAAPDLGNVEDSF